MPLSDFQIEGQLGKGAFATVHRCKRKVDGKVYALKKIDIRNLPQKDKVNALNEIRILASVSGPNIIQYKESFYDEESNSLCIVMEYADGGDLMSKITKHRNQGTIPQEKQIWKIAYQMLKGLKTLHDAKILHRDIKSANIFLSNDIAKIGDLNISKLLQSDMATTQTGTPYYTCPEIWKDMPYSYKGDVWSLGCVIYEMCMLKPPFRAQQFEGLYQKVTSGVYERISFVYTSALNLFISRCLIVDEGKRASVDELLNSAFFKQFEKNTRKGAEIQADNSLLMKPMDFPRNLSEINNIVPEPQYERKPKKKPKTVIIVDQRDQEMREAENAMMQTLDQLGVKKPTKGSEKLIPVSPIVPSKSIEKGDSSHKAAMMRIRSLHRSQTKVITHS